MANLTSPRLFSYVVKRDLGFAPNPFHGICTLGTCKPDIRHSARLGDWIWGTGARKTGLEGHLVYAMRVDEITTFNDYWSEARFRCKRPQINGSLTQVHGDNIYHRDATSGAWKQAESHHSLEGGGLNEDNLNRDTKYESVLISRRFAYFGRNAPRIPNDLVDANGRTLTKSGPGHKQNFTDYQVRAAIEWLTSLDQWGCHGRPFGWSTIGRLREPGFMAAK